MEGLGYLPTHTLDAPHGLHINLLWRKLDGGITGMNSCKLNVFGDSISQDFTVFGHGIHFYLLGMFDELGDHDRMVFAHIGCQPEETFQLFFIGTYIHGCSRKNVGRTHKNRESHTGDEIVDVFHTRKRTPFGLVDAMPGEHLRELGAVFGTIDIFGLGAKKRHMLLGQLHGQIVGNLAAGGNNHTMGRLKFDDVHDTLKSEFVKIKTVAHVIVGGNRLRIVVDHH